MKKVLLFLIMASLLYAIACTSPTKLSEKEKTAFEACKLDVEENNLRTENLDFDVPKISTKDYCYNRVAHQTKNPDICSNIGHYELKDDCIYRYAVSSKNTTMCGRIQIDQIKRNCEIMASPQLILKSGYAE